MEDSAESSSNPISQGCGPHTQISIHISPTTGGDFFLTVDPDITVDNLKKLVSKKLKVPRDRLCLLFRDKQLQEGNLTQHGVADGSKVTLLPNVETGLVTQRPEVGIMQALESLNDTQVNEFLCGKAPLNLSMRLGDHMMLIQLQLSTVSGAKPPPQPPGSPQPSRPPSLIQASRNLQHTLRRLSADVFSGRGDDSPRQRKHQRRHDHSRRSSVYSGTFSGALNPALQDPKGRPRRDVATIVHILNDLLCSAPDLRRVRRSVDEASSTSSVIEQDEEPAPSTCSEDQNLRTRGKLEQLRLVMGERRERRRQRKQKPYSLPQSDNTDTVTA
ncbi:PREDICTED: midnolin isoform X1 [Nicrophorus vespilloides]|uniref:Midnolin isoform X1 n=1 Tax=Nicrophorus vespilloides TaxID=110193 RepID=A0ABM1MNI3_NICVS|nr:PREDICTED: midnolin isoform X1 [Nicrophorus vespilloides]XP_017776133.1 PREDICTED: midnolin isoform X1 [Nicrophorus vespilloides]